MKMEGSIALVTGANRGIGKAFAEALIAAGAAKVYAGARDPSSITDPGLVPIKLDVTSAADIAAAAERCGDVSLLVNNAGILLSTSMLAANAADAMRREMAVNVFGMHAMIEAFAPILARNGGGAIVNLLSVMSWFVMPTVGTYSASKHAAQAVSDGARIALKAQGTLVVGVYPGFVDTDMTVNIDRPKVPPRQIAERTIEGIRMGVNHIHPDDRSQELWREVCSNPAGLDARMQQMWDGLTGGRSTSGG